MFNCNKAVEEIIHTEIFLGRAMKSNCFST